MLEHAVAQLVETLRYRRVRFPMVSLEFFIDINLPATLWPWGRSTSNRNEYQEYFHGGKDGRCVGLTSLPPSCADCVEIWEPQPRRTLRAFQACNRIALPLPLPFTGYVNMLFTGRVFFTLSLPLCDCLSISIYNPKPCMQTSHTPILLHVQCIQLTFLMGGGADHPTPSSTKVTNG